MVCLSVARCGYCRTCFPRCAGDSKRALSLYPSPFGGSWPSRLLLGDPWLLRSLSLLASGQLRLVLAPPVLLPFFSQACIMHPRAPAFPAPPLRLHLPSKHCCSCASWTPWTRACDTPWRASSYRRRQLSRPCSRTGSPSAREGHRNGCGQGEHRPPLPAFLCVSAKGAESPPRAYVQHVCGCEVVARGVGSSFFDR